MKHFWNETRRAAVHWGLDSRQTPPPLPRAQRGKSRAKVAKRIERFAHLWTQESPLAPPEVIQAVAGWLGRMGSRERSIKRASLDLLEEALGYHLVAFDPGFLDNKRSKPAQPDLIDFWWAAEGPEFAVDAWLSAWQWSMTWTSLNFHEGAPVAMNDWAFERSSDADTDSEARWLHRPWWWGKGRGIYQGGRLCGETMGVRRLRSRIGAEAEEVQARLRAKAEGFWGAAPALLKAAICYLFPGRADQWSEALEGVLAHPGTPKPQPFELMVAAAPDVDALIRLPEVDPRPSVTGSFGWGLGETFPMTLLERFGEGLRPLVQAMTRRDVWPYSTSAAALDAYLQELVGGRPREG